MWCYKKKFGDGLKVWLDGSMDASLEFGMIMYSLGAALYRRFVSFGLL